MTNNAIGKSETSSSEWLEMLLFIARYYGLSFSPEDARLTSAWSEKEGLVLVRDIAQQLGLSMKIFKELSIKELNHWRLPILVQLLDGKLIIVESISHEDGLLVRYGGELDLITSISKEELILQFHHGIILRPDTRNADSRVDEYIKPYEEKWFNRIILKDLKSYRYIAYASFVANMMGLAGVLFSMQVYDRVVPAKSAPTLYVLFFGVVIAGCVDFIARTSRSHLIDVLGKRADMRLSDMVFGHSIRLRSSSRPRSTGTFISQLRDIDQIRELITSSTVSVLADLPFFFLFLLVFWNLVGYIVFVPLFAVAFMIGPGLLCQGKLQRLGNESMREASLRNSLLVETIQGLDDVKGLQAEQYFQRKWNHYNNATATANLQLKELTHRLQTWSQCVQALVFALVIFFGAPMVMDGDLTTGALIAASILGSRMMAPMSYLTQIITKWQQAKTALIALDQLMQKPTDYPQGTNKIHRPKINGNLKIKSSNFGYEKNSVLRVDRINVRAGERIAILGRNGAGKSTLLKSLVGEVELFSGRISWDDVPLQQLDPCDLRRDIALLTQDARLFHGSLRENLLLGSPLANDDEILFALALTGADRFIEKLPTGLDYIIHEGGIGLSGGQKQALLLSRTLLRNPRVLLLDEPTAALDEASERHFLERLEQYIEGRTLIVSTHRPAFLELVERIIVIDNGEVLIDKPREEALRVLSSYTRTKSADRGRRENHNV
ncbi:TPA: type I secretion system permease/ATPase [Pseudomonas aeruginosa]|nr:type I secretion system permease/ATPase [Pseudomonas aeruginosa]HEJ1204056.1 type I secretion system permease/ATPase [Pseudomonas aeruginosa]HEJ5398199.1 type I secretion system permease/ATPase [Pseudomonas aeruginosa]